MPFRPVFIVIVIAFALILGAFLIQRARPRVELDQPNANFVRATGVLHAGVAFHAFTESNSFLGKGGVRLLLDYPQLARTQLKSLLRLSQAQDIRILVPMVTLECDMQQIRELLVSVAHEMGIETLFASRRNDRNASRCADRRANRKARGFPFRGYQRPHPIHSDRQTR